MSVRITGTGLAPFIVDAADLVEGPHGGLVPHRLTARARTQVNDLLFRWVEGNTAGVRVLAATDADALTVTVHGTSIAMPGGEPGVPNLVVRVHPRSGVADPLAASARVVDIATFDVLAVDTVSLRIDRIEGESCTVTADLPAGGATVEVLLPHGAPLEIVTLEADRPVEPGVDARPRWLHHGSSISHSTNAPDPSRTIPQQVADAWNVRLRNLAFGGNAQADQFTARMIRDTPADLITLCIGVNLVNADSMRERTFLPALHGFLDTVRDGHATTPLVLIGAIICPIHEGTPGPVIDDGGTMRPSRRDVEKDEGALTVSRARQIAYEVAQARMVEDPHLSWVDGREFFGADDAPLLTDRLHPSPGGNDLISERILGRWGRCPIG